MSFGDDSRAYRFQDWGACCFFVLQVLHTAQLIFMMQGAPRDVAEWNIVVENIDKVIDAIPQKTGTLGDSSVYGGFLCNICVRYGMHI